MHNKYYDRLEKKDGFYELNIDSFNDFIDLLRPDNLNINRIMTLLRYKTNPLLINFVKFDEVKITSPSILDNSLVYRGHGNSEWELKSTFDRQEFDNFFIKNFTYRHQAEFELLKNFQDSCDLAGVYLPSDGSEIRKKQLKHYNEFFGVEELTEVKMEWFNQEFFELAAFAQHYGVPTRLLDWSKNPFVACYFANSNALEQNYDLNKKITIWVLNYTDLDSTLKNVLKILDLPKGVNQHISHQQGVLTYTELNDELYSLILEDSKEKMLPTSLNKILEHYKNEFRLLKINLGFEHLTRLYQYCNAHNFNACHLFRGAYGAALHTKDIMNYEKFNFEEKIEALI